MSKKGFTLIELLVVITIIALLSAIGFVAYSYVIKQSRDAKRQSDLKSIQFAIEQYYDDQGFYPYTTSGGGSISYDGLDEILDNAPPGSFTNQIGNPVGVPFTKTYLNPLPQDPTGSLRYRYEAGPVGCDNVLAGVPCISYCLYAKLEGSNPGRPTACDTYTSYNFAITQP